jgi:hypothetical protein
MTRLQALEVEVRPFLKAMSKLAKLLIVVVLLIRLRRANLGLGSEAGGTLEAIGINKWAARLLARDERSSIQGHLWDIGFKPTSITHEKLNPRDRGMGETLMPQQSLLLGG